MKTRILLWLTAGFAVFGVLINAVLFPILKVVFAPYGNLDNTIVIILRFIAGEMWEGIFAYLPLLSAPFLVVVMFHLHSKTKFLSKPTAAFVLFYCGLVSLQFIEALSHLWYFSIFNPIPPAYSTPVPYWLNFLSNAALPAHYLYIPVTLIAGVISLKGVIKLPHRSDAGVVINMRVVAKVLGFLAILSLVLGALFHLLLILAFRNI